LLLIACRPPAAAHVLAFGSPPAHCSSPASRASRLPASPAARFPGCPLPWLPASRAAHLTL
jgi:hypothetical protein